MIPKAHEDTITTLLKEELERLGVKAEAFAGITTPAGLRKPDIICADGGVYPLEAKFSERDLITAIAKVQNDYLKYHKVLGVRGGFAILYPEKLARPMPIEAVKDLALKSRFRLIAMFPPEDARPFRVYDGRLEEVAKLLAEHVLRPPKYVEPSIDYIIKSLRDSAMYIFNGLKHLASHELEGFFGGKDVFKNILQYEEEKYPVEELRFAAAYLMINQLLFYHALSRLRDEFDEIDPDNIKNPVDLTQYFARVLDVNYKTVFSYDVASLIPPKFSEEVRTIINVIKGLSPEKVGGDLLGTIFHDLIPFDVRKRVAAFYTNVLAAELLASLAIHQDDDNVGDLAVGSGGLLVASYRRKKELLKETFTQKVHKRFVEEELLGVDVMPFAANIAACHLALQSPEFFTNKVKMAVWDSTDLKPRMVIPSVAELRAVLTGQTFLDTFAAPKHEIKGVVSLGEKKAEDINLKSLDLVIMNPPFTRQERIPEAYKKVLLDRFSDYKEYLHGQLGFYGYFILLADRFLKDGGKMALVLPATVLRVRSCEGLRKLWAGRYHVEHIITTWHRSAFSESVRFREMLLLARKTKCDKSAKTTMTVLKELPKTLADARDMAKAITLSHKDWEDHKMVLKIQEYSKLESDTSNWFRYVAVSDLSLVDLMEELLKSEKLTTLHSLLSKLGKEMVRGIETSRGGKIQALTISRAERAVKKSDVWILRKVQKRSIEAHNRLTRRELRIPFQALRPALRRVSLVNRIDISDELDYVVADKFPKVEEFLASSLETFKPIVGFWGKWRAYVKDRMSQLALVRRIDVSAPGTCLLAFYSGRPMAPPGVAWAVKLKSTEAKIFSLWFNSTINLLQTFLERKETRGAFLQLDEYVLEECIVPELSRISKSESRLLLNTFESVKDTRFPSILEQLKHSHEGRMLIDKAWLKILGYKGDVNSLLDKLYSSLANEIELLKRLMSEGEVEEEA